MANDHIAATRAALRAAQFLGIRTAYVQHASVTEAYPALDFDYAFLDGLDALSKYRVARRANPTGVFLSGSPYRPVLAGAPPRESPSLCLGLATALRDDHELVARVLEAAGHCPGVGEVIVRHHPRERRPEMQTLVARAKLEADCRDSPEELRDFLASIDVLVASDSSIHLEAVAAGIPSLAYRGVDASSFTDTYGYVAKGLAREYPLAELCRGIQTAVRMTADEVKVRAQHFYADLNTEYDGRTAVAIARTLDALVDDTAPPDFWVSLDADPRSRPGEDVPGEVLALAQRSDR